jgi:hypothetical protein
MKGKPTQFYGLQFVENVENGVGLDERVDGERTK